MLKKFVCICLLLPLISCESAPYQGFKSTAPEAMISIKPVDQTVVQYDRTVLSLVPLDSSNEPTIESFGTDSLSLSLVVPPGRYTMDLEYFLGEVPVLSSKFCTHLPDRPIHELKAREDVEVNLVRLEVCFPEGQGSSDDETAPQNQDTNQDIQPPPVVMEEPNPRVDDPPSSGGEPSAELPDSRPPATGDILFLDFESYDPGEATLPFRCSVEIMNDFGSCTSGSSRDPNRFITKKNGSNVLGFDIPAEYGNSQSGSFSVNVEPRKEYTLSYRLKFDDDFEWSRGGKLPGGFAGGGAFTGCNSAHEGNGFSVRLMWYDYGVILPYIYHKNHNRCGDNFYGDRVPESPEGQMLLKKNIWNEVKIYTKLNSLDGDQSNGELRIWINGRVLVDADNMEFCTQEYDCNIEQLRFEAFRGGANSRWSGEKGQALYVDAIKLN